MDVFPAFFPLAGRRVVVAGEGEAAEAKARLFEGSPAEVSRLNGPDALDPRAYIGATLAFVAARDDNWALAAADAARAANVPVNVVDRPTLCDFTTPAVIDRGQVAALFRSLQAEIRDALPEAAARRRFLRAALNGPPADAARNGDMEAAKTQLRAALSEGAATQGQVRYLDARGPADLLSLRAVRALAAADVLVADADTHPDVMALARRDAERRSSCSAAELAELVAEGLSVVRLVTTPAWRAEQTALDAAGVSVDVLPVASQSPTA